jgi:phospholipase D1/2
MMNGEPYTASAYACSLRRQLFRQHLGLLPNQEYNQPNQNFQPIDKDPNIYDWDTPGDLLVRDVLSEDFHLLWTKTASINTVVFSKAFHCVPADNILNWKDYDEFYGSLFVPKGEGDDAKPSKYLYGHVVADEFPGGVQELKAELAKVRGTLVEMPLKFMEGVDFAKEGLALNAFTDEIYT